jgi:hypothetical protein
VVDHGWLGWWRWAAAVTWGSTAAAAAGQGRDASNGNGNEGENVGKLHFERLFGFVRSGGFESLIVF